MKKSSKPIYEVHGEFKCEDCGINAGLLKVLHSPKCGGKSKLVLCRDCLDKRLDQLIKVEE